MEEREVHYSEIKKGYELGKNKYVVIEKQDFENIAAESTRTINIKEFINEELDPLFVEKSYYISPDSMDKKRKKGKASSSSVTIQDKAYSLLVKALHDMKKIAIGKLVLREGEKEHLVAIRAYQRGFVMHTLHFIDEIKPVDDLRDL